MERARVFRYLRIAVTALSLTACVLLIALWVRSYYRVYQVSGGIGYNFYLQSLGGQIVLGAFTDTPPSWKFISLELKPDMLQHRADTAFMFDVHPKAWYLIFPHWAPILMMLVLATLTWIPWSKRFSLRTLLIATTLVAVGLGIIAVSS